MRTPPLHRLRLAFAAGIAALALLHIASAQSWPTRPITMVVPFPAGGAPDIVARFLAEDLGQRLGQRVVVENRTGASGNIGALSVAKARARRLHDHDGDALSDGVQQADVERPEVRSGAGLRADRAGRQVAANLCLAARPCRPRTSRRSIAYAAANPGKLNVGIPGIGTTSHIALEYLLNVSGTQGDHRDLSRVASAERYHRRSDRYRRGSCHGLCRDGAKRRASRARGDKQPAVRAPARHAHRRRNWAFRISRRRRGTCWPRRPEHRQTSFRSSMPRPMTTCGARRARSSSSRSICRPVAEARRGEGLRRQRDRQVGPAHQEGQHPHVSPAVGLASTAA